MTPTLQTQGFAAAREWVSAFLTTPGRFKEFCRYTGVSATSLGLDIAVFKALVYADALGPAMAGAWSCMAGLVLHYLLSVHVVFDPRATGKSDRRLLGEYAATGVMGFTITATSIFAVVDLLGLPADLGKLIGIGLTFVSVYLVRAGVVFAPEGGVVSAARTRAMKEPHRAPVAAGPAEQLSTSD